MRERNSPKNPPCGVGGDNGKLRAADEERKRNRSFNYSRYKSWSLGIKGMRRLCTRVTAFCSGKHFLLLFCGALSLLQLRSSPQNIDQSFCACECFVCFSPRAFSSTVYIFSSLLLSLPFSLSCCLHAPANTLLNIPPIWHHTHTFRDVQNEIAEENRSADSIETEVIY